MTLKHALPAAAIALALAVVSLGAQQDTGRPPDEGGAFRFKSGVVALRGSTRLGLHRPDRPRTVAVDDGL
jgi:hypothetical protein